MWPKWEVKPKRVCCEATCLTSACATLIWVMIPLWSSRLSFTIGICVLAELISWCRRWFSTLPCDSFSWACSSLSRSSASCLFSSVTSLTQASCSGGKIKYIKNEIKRLTHCSDYQTQHDASVAADLSGQPVRALVASTEWCCQLRSPKFSSSVFLCGELPLHTAYQPPVAQSGTWPLQGCRLFSSIVALMDNFLVDENLYKFVQSIIHYHGFQSNETVFQSLFWCIHYKEYRCVGFFFPLTFRTNCDAFNEQLCRSHWFRVWVSGLKPALKKSYIKYIK